MKNGILVDSKEILSAYANKNEDFKKAFEELIRYELKMLYKDPASDNIKASF